MQRDFHYYAVAVMARAAGFAKADALTLAYASQYVDDATESETIDLGGVPFEPTCTAYSGVGYIASHAWSVQKRVYVPFHFLPPKPIRNAKDTLVTEPDSAFSHGVVERALAEKNPLRRLCALGIALHTYADTWAHQGFSGRNEPGNDVGRIYLCAGRTWKRVVWKDHVLDLLPKVGHAEAGAYPDQPFRVWRYERKSDGAMITRRNPEDCLEAAARTYDWLRKARGRGRRARESWAALAPRFRRLFRQREESEVLRCRAWERAFGGWFEPLAYHYESTAWIDDAVHFEGVQRPRLEDLPKLDYWHLLWRPKPKFYESPWVQFHRAALEQRHFVLERLT